MREYREETEAKLATRSLDRGSWTAEEVLRLKSECELRCKHLYWLGRTDETARETKLDIAHSARRPLNG